MSNKMRGFIDIELDKPRRLRFDWNALAEIEEKIGVPITKFSEIAVSAKNIRAILWIGLKHEDASLTEEAVGAMVDFGNIGYVQERITDAFSASNGAVKDLVKKNEETLSAGKS